MKHQTHMAEHGRSNAWIRLLGVCAAAALLAALWTAAGASAQSGPTVAAEYGGLAQDAELSIQNEINSTGPLSIDEGSFGSQDIGNASWVCESLRCRYLNVTWSGIPPRAAPGEAYTITVARNRIPTARDIGVTDEEFAELPVATQMSLSISGSSASQQYLPTPWVGETVTVTVSGEGAEASAAVKIPAPRRPAVFTSRAAANQVGATLAADPDDAELPIVMSVWRRVSGATHYEVQYTFRTRSRNRDSGNKERVTKVSRIVKGSDISDQSGESHQQYSSFSANWSQHPNASVRALRDSDFGAGGAWMGALITLPELLAGETDWPADALAAKTAITAALREGKKHSVGVRVRPLAACGALLLSVHCPERYLEQEGVLALWGRKSKIAYVRFRGANVQEWISSAAGG